MDFTLQPDSSNRRLADYVQEVFATFGMSITTATAGNYLAEDCFKNREAQSKTQGFEFDRLKLSGIA